MAAQRRRDQLADAKTELELAEMRLKLERLRTGAPADRPLDVETIERVVTFLRTNLDMIVVPRRGGRPIDEGGGLRELLELARPALPMLAEMLTPRGGPPSPIAPPAPAPPAPAPAIEAAAAPVAVVPAEAALPWPLRLVLGRLGAMAADQAAAWLATQPQPELRQWVAVLTETAPESLWTTLDAVAEQPDAGGRPSPQVGAVVGWLRARGPWTEGVAAELRRRALAERNGAAPPQ